MIWYLLLWAPVLRDPVSGGNPFSLDWFSQVNNKENWKLYHPRLPAYRLIRDVEMLILVETTTLLIMYRTSSGIPEVHEIHKTYQMNCYYKLKTISPTSANLQINPWRRNADFCWNTYSADHVSNFIERRPTGLLTFTWIF